MRSLRWGILGPGGIARATVGDLQLVGIEVAAVGSRSLERARAFAAEFGIRHAYGSYEELVASGDVDIVYVASPHIGHAEHAVLALEAGKHVLVEKPFALNAREAAAIQAAAIANERIVLEAMWTRWLPHIVRIRELLDAGTLGELRTIFADHGQALPLDPEHRLQNPELGGGALLDLGIYPVSFAFDIFGAPTRVAATATFTPTGVDRQTAILLGHGEGRQSLLHAELDARTATRASIVGTAARIEIDGAFYAPSSAQVIAEDGTVIETIDGELAEGQGRQFQAIALEAAIRAGLDAVPELPPSESVAIMAILDEIRSQIGLVYPAETRAHRAAQAATGGDGG